MLVFVGFAVIDQIAGHDSDVRCRYEFIYGRHGPREIWPGIEFPRHPFGAGRHPLNRPAEQLAGRDDVRIGKLGDNHRPSGTLNPFDAAYFRGLTAYVGLSEIGMTTPSKLYLPVAGTAVVRCKNFMAEHPVREIRETLVFS